MINSIKLLIYKENPSIFEKLNFDDDAIFLEPLLFAYFNSKKENLFSETMLLEILQGFFIEKETLLLEESFNKYGIAYVPNLGYFDKTNKKIDTICIVEKTKIELIKYPIVHLKIIFKDFNENVIDENKIELSKALSVKYEKQLTNAFQYIKTSSKEHFELIEQCCKKIVLFKTDPKNTNSFATINAHGIAFFNVYQEDYDEVFFIDDIAHQTGHIIMTSILFERKNYFKIDENLNVSLLTNEKSEYRSFYILFHALYTYYTSILCLDSCIDNSCLNKRQIHEAYGRIGFYLLKYKSDLERFEKIEIKHKGIENILTYEGIEIFNMIKFMYAEKSKKHIGLTKQLKFYNQPYNFTYSKFLELNPMKNG
jgi:hypothetical protein